MVSQLMLCSTCRRFLQNTANFCDQCGQRFGSPPLRVLWTPLSAPYSELVERYRQQQYQQYYQQLAAWYYYRPYTQTFAAPQPLRRVYVADEEDDETRRPKSEPWFTRTKTDRMAEDYADKRSRMLSGRTFDSYGNSEPRSRD